MLFSNRKDPLPERCRPMDFSSFFGQEHLLAPGKVLARMLESGSPLSLILWGDPGTGKTTLARLMAGHFNLDAHYLSAVSAGVSDVRKVIDKGKANRTMNVSTLLFLDEIHRFNKAQQDAVLGAVEAGDIILLGATTENPSFSVIAPLLSRTRVLKLNRLTNDDLKNIIDHSAAHDQLFTEKGLTFGDGAEELLIENAGGDGRRLLNLLETSYLMSDDGRVDAGMIAEAVKNSLLYYDKKGDRHYDTISAFIKSLRGSDPDGAVYYLARMILGGEDPVFIARRMVIFASEDVGNAAPQGLNLAVSALEAVKNIGMPESEIILAHCATYLASAPKSNASYLAIKRAKAEASSEREIPMHIRNAPTGLMKDMGYSKGYNYPHDFPGHFVPGEEYLPEDLKGTVYYEPTDSGSEAQIRQRLIKLWPERYQKE
jgi:putative ATPase